MADVFMSIELMFFMWSDSISSIFVRIDVYISNFYASVFPTTLLLFLILSSRSSNDVASV